MVKLVVWSNSGVRCSASTVRKRMPLISPESEPTDQYARMSGSECSWRASAVGPPVCSEVRGELIDRLEVRLDGAW
jgi:hypothetical protein